MRMHFLRCVDQTSQLGVAGWLVGCLLASLLTCAMCAQQCIGESVLEPHLIYVISHLSHLTWYRGRERNTALCAHPPLHLSL